MLSIHVEEERRMVKQALVSQQDRKKISFLQQVLDDPAMNSADMVEPPLPAFMQAAYCTVRCYHELGRMIDDPQVDQKELSTEIIMYKLANAEVNEYLRSIPSKELGDVVTALRTRHLQ